MKELSIEQKAKAYDEALKKAKDMLSYKEVRREDMEYLFPELKESEDERMLREIKRYIKEQGDKPTGLPNGTAAVADMIAWLEKQGAKVSAIEGFESEFERQVSGLIASAINKEHEYNQGYVKWTANALLNYAKHELEKQDKQKTIDNLTPQEAMDIAVTKCFEQDELNLTDKVKPKFKVGDWIVSDYNNVAYIESISETKYNLQCKDGSHEKLSIEYVDKCWHLWTIQDAKDCDVLVSESNCGLGTWYCIFKSLDDDESMTVYCYLARDGRFETKKELCFDKDPFNTKPATKEQRDTLMKAMADAGYTFDFEKKELKKIEQKSAWSEEDENKLSSVLFLLHEYKNYNFDRWLKSLRPQNRWKPSDEQMRVLDLAIRCGINRGTTEETTLVSLFNDLKKLK